MALWSQLPEELKEKLGQLQRQAFNNLAIERQPGSLFHYTTTEGFKGIVSSVCIWATDILYLSDASEGRHCMTILKKVVKHRNDWLTASIKKSIDPWDAIPGLGKDYFAFSASFCEEGDLLSQWTGYTSPAGRYAIRVNGPALLTEAAKGKEFVLFPVVYDEKLWTQEVTSLLDRVLQIAPPNNSACFKSAYVKYFGAWIMPPFLFSLKHPAFEQEAEWRLLVTLTEEAARSRAQFRTCRGSEIPYIAVRLPTGAIQGVVLGPGNITSSDECAVRRLLDRFGHGQASIEKSAIPLR